MNDLHVAAIFISVSSGFLLGSIAWGCLIFGGFCLFSFLIGSIG